MINHTTGTLRACLPDRLWDGMADTRDTGLAPLVKAATIVAVAPVAEIPAACEIVPLPGCTIMPGRIDSHVHFTEHAGPAFLSAGVTTVRDTGSHFDWILARRAAMETRDFSVSARITARRSRRTPGGRPAGSGR